MSSVAGGQASSRTRAFLSGDFLKTTAQRREVYDAVHIIASSFGVSDDTLWAALAWSVVLIELGLCWFLLTEDAPVPTAALGVAMHMGFEFVGRLSIGRFSWYMAAFYLLLLHRMVERTPHLEWLKLDYRPDDDDDHED